MAMLVVYGVKDFAGNANASLRGTVHAREHALVVIVR